MAVNREDANPALLQTPVGDDARIVPGAPVLPQTPTGGPWPSPTNRGKRRGQTGTHKLHNTANPCRGRCSHRPADLAPPRTPAGGISGLRAAAARRLASETRLRAQCKHRPLQRFAVQRERGFSGLAAGLPSVVGADSISPAGVCAAAGCGGMRASRPTDARVVVAAPFGRTFARVCRGGPWSSRGCLRRRGVPRDDASIVPYRGL